MASASQMRKQNEQFGEDMTTIQLLMESPLTLNAPAPRPRPTYTEFSKSALQDLTTQVVPTPALDLATKARWLPHFKLPTFRTDFKKVVGVNAKLLGRNPTNRLLQQEKVILGSIEREIGKFGEGEVVSCEIFRKMLEEIDDVEGSKMVVSRKRVGEMAMADRDKNDDEEMEQKEKKRKEKKKEKKKRYKKNLRERLKGEKRKREMKGEIKGGGGLKGDEVMELDT